MQLICLASFFASLQVFMMRCWNGEKGEKAEPRFHDSRRGRSSLQRRSGDASLASKGVGHSPEWEMALGSAKCALWTLKK